MPFPKSFRQAIGIPRLALLAAVLLSILPGRPQAQTDASEAWANLQAAASNVGFCAYQIGQADDACTCIPGLDGSDSAVVLSRQWASERIQGWAERVGHAPESLLLLYGRNMPEHRRMGNSDNFFLIVPMPAFDSLRWRMPADSVCRSLTLVASDTTILHNIYWREFMSNRPGQLLLQAEMGGTRACADAPCSDIRRFAEALKAWAKRFRDDD